MRLVLSLTLDEDYLLTPIQLRARIRLCFSVYMIFDKLEPFFNGQLSFWPDSLTRKSFNETSTIVCDTLEQMEGNITDATNNLNTAKHELDVLEVELSYIDMKIIEEDEAPMGCGYHQRRDNPQFSDGNNDNVDDEDGDDMEGYRM